MNHARLRRTLPLLGAVCLLSSPAPGHLPDDEVEVESSSAPILLPEEDSVTYHEVEKDGEVIRYRATAGTLPLFNESDGEVRACT